MPGDKKISEFTEVETLEKTDWIAGVRPGSPNEDIIISKEKFDEQMNDQGSDRGDFTINEDGSGATVNGGVVNHKVFFDTDPSAVVYSIGDTVTNDDTGATGKVVARVGTVYTLDTLTAGGWNDNDDLSSGAGALKVKGGATWVITMPVGFAKLILFTASCNYYSDANNFRRLASFGKGDAVQDDCLQTMYQKALGATYNTSGADIGDAIAIADKDSNGWLGYIGEVRDDEVDVYLYYAGTTGLNTQVAYHAITGM